MPSPFAVDRPAPEPEAIAEVTYQAITDGSTQLRYTAGDDAHQMLAQREAVGDQAFIEGIKQKFGLTSQAAT